MVGLVAVLKIKPGLEEKVNNAMLKMTEAVLEHEKDCLFYEPGEISSFYSRKDGSARSCPSELREGWII